MLRKLRERLTKPYHIELEEDIVTRIKPGEMTEETPLPQAIDILYCDSLDIVNLQMLIEEESPDVPIDTVGDLLWLLKAIEFRRRRRK